VYREFPGLRYGLLYSAGGEPDTSAEARVRKEKEPAVYKLSIFSCVTNNVKSESIIIIIWKCGTVQIFGNDYNKSKPDSGGN
jgi:hypothetical protein